MVARLCRAVNRNQAGDDRLAGFELVEDAGVGKYVGV
jgi:hypothetical protein